MAILQCIAVLVGACGEIATFIQLLQRRIVISIAGDRAEADSHAGTGINYSGSEHKWGLG